jgi:hypothetical protein
MNIVAAPKTPRSAAAFVSLSSWAMTAFSLAHSRSRWASKPAPLQHTDQYRTLRKVFGLAPDRSEDRCHVLCASAILDGDQRASAEFGEVEGEGRKIVIRKAFLIDNIDLSLLPSDNRGEVNVSLFAVGDCCGCPTKDAADRR